MVPARSWRPRFAHHSASRNADSGAVRYGEVVRRIPFFRSSIGEMPTGEKKVPTNALPVYGEAPFYIPATGTASRPRQTLKHNDTFAVFDSHGDIGATPGGSDGLFDRDTRYLSHFELLINGCQPLLLGSAIRDDNLSLYVDLTNPDLYENGGITLPKDTVHIGRTIYLNDGSLCERIALTNHGTHDVRLTLSLIFGSDFADIFEVRGVRRLHRGKASSRVPADGKVLLSYRGLDDVRRETAVGFEPAPDRLTATAATYSLQLAPGASQIIFAMASSRGRLPASAQSFSQGTRQPVSSAQIRDRKSVV